MANSAGFRTLRGQWPWPWPWLTLKLISLNRSHRALSKLRINLWVHWVWLWRPFSPSLKSRDTWHVTREGYRKFGPREILYWLPVSESQVSSHPWSISWDEIDRKVRQISNFGRLVILTLTLNQGQTGTACTTYCPLPSTKVSFKSETKSVDGRTDIETGFRSSRRDDLKIKNTVRNIPLVQK